MHLRNWLISHRRCLSCFCKVEVAYNDDDVCSNPACRRWYFYPGIESYRETP